jgi:hydrogenase/urease accessory protein HupE
MQSSARGSAGLAGGGFSGLTDPGHGWEHIAAIVAVGLWAAPLVRAAGGVVALTGLAFLSDGLV